MKRLYKDRFDKKLGGVCGGLAQYFQIDANIIRLAFVLLAMLSFGGVILVYIILWALLPLGPKSYIEAQFKRLYRSKKDRKFAGICGGVGEYLECDSNIIRVLFLIVCATTGFFPLILAYFVGIGIIPERP